MGPRDRKGKALWAERKESSHQESDEREGCPGTAGGLPGESAGFAGERDLEKGVPRVGHN